jgi:diacylglycerol kinase
MIKPKYQFFHRLFLAIQGLFIAIKRERHMKIHLLTSILLLAPLFWIDTDPTNIWLLIILLALLFVVELINTAIETTIDLITRRFSYRAKLAKDMSSGAVLIIAALALIFSIFIYWPSMYNLMIGVIVGS